MSAPALCIVNAALRWDDEVDPTLLLGSYRLGHVVCEWAGPSARACAAFANGTRIGTFPGMADAKAAVESVVAGLVGVPSLSRESALAWAEQAVYDAPLTLTGDPMGVMILDSEFIRGETVQENIAQVRQVCREVAQAVLPLTAALPQSGPAKAATAA